MATIESTKVLTIKFHKMNRGIKILICLVILVTWVKVDLLINKGSFYFPDENRYRKSVSAIFYFEKFEIKQGLRKLFKVEARPASAVFYLIPAGIQALSHRIFQNESVFAPANSFAIFFFNIFLHLTIAYFIYKLASKYFNDPIINSLSVLIYISLDSSFIYLQHALPYDLALSLLLLALLMISNDNGIFVNKSHTYLLAGCLTSLGFLSYPGYLLLCVVIFGFVIIDFFREKCDFKGVSIFGLGALGTILIFELVSYYIGLSYIKTAFILSKTITQGSFEETLSFIFKYLSETEGIRGIVLLSGVLGFLFYRSRRGLREIYKDDFLIVISLCLLTYFGYGINGYFFHKNVNYGRLIHQFIPFLSIAAGWMICRGITLAFKKQVLRNLLFSICCMFFIVSGVYSLYKFNKYLYPRDVIWNKRFFFNEAGVFKISETSGCARDDFERENRGVESFNRKNLQYTLVNFCYYYPLEGVIEQELFIPDKGQIEILNAEHIINYSGYQFEGYSIEARENIRKLNPHLKVFKTISN